MGAMQAVVHDVRDALSIHFDGFSLERANEVAREVEIIPNPRSLPPSVIAREVPGGFAPQLTPPEIIRLADWATGQGWRINRFQLVDRRMSLLPEPEQSEVSSELVEAIRDGGSYRMQIALQDHYPGVFINGVQLILYPRITIDIRHRGVLFSNDPEELNTFLRAAWKALRLS
ncbi:hypothetical protein FHX49_000019 [Microbacterium endophyticum]|uniref:Uncharacterized protein n=1 Tax=Microbacterium endophyticum TaxID=1526412 RepID=A0A7W4V1N4_9MICO|nr:hypothetical protein [Microbacterium endophyticum]MBB2974478.1 hypothetical protein [Microbacterium endophyticum]NIK36775.1 hypothetical protein [Microbacterium endophyticum]